MERQPIEHRDALYYPFIHFEDEAWVRNQLLFFPHVLRMIPVGLQPADSPFVRELAEARGRGDRPLVGSYRLDSNHVFEASMRLAGRLRDDATDPRFREKYDRSATRKKWGRDDVFLIHECKFCEPLRLFLENNGLIWGFKQPRRGPEWLGLHPAVGEVVMSTMAIAAAEDQGLDVLTDEGVDHLLSATRDEGAIYDTLLGGSARGSTGRKPKEVEIAQLIFATRFDLSGLGAEDLAALSRDEALYDFRQLLADRVAAMPAMADPRVRLERATEAAEEIVEAWEKRRRTRSSFLKRLVVGGADEAKNVFTALANLFVPAGVSAAGTAVAVAATGGVSAGGGLLVAVPGLAVGLVTHGVKTWLTMGTEESQAPTRFLSLVTKYGGVLTAAGRPAMH